MELKFILSGRTLDETLEWSTRSSSNPSPKPNFNSKPALSRPQPNPKPTLTLTLPRAVALERLDVASSFDP